jgi:hypothetical protein
MRSWQSVATLLFAVLRLANVHAQLGSNSAVEVVAPATAASQQLYTAVASGAWNDPAVWAPQGPPVANADVVIPSGVRVVWSDTGSMVLGNITVNGQLACAETPLAILLTVTSILVLGPRALLECGRPQAPFWGSLSITLTGGCAGQVARGCRSAVCVSHRRVNQPLTQQRREREGVAG